MFDLVNTNNEHQYSLYHSKYIKENKKNYIEYAELALKRFCHYFPTGNSTFYYSYYNLVPFTFGSLAYYDFYKSLKKVIREYTKTDKPLWFQSWLNFHKVDEVLTRHTHENTICHGYVSIEPKITKTVFDDYVIDNKVGLLYIGPGLRYHKVEVVKPFNGYRITIAFDVVDEKTIEMIYASYGNIDVNVGFLPVD